jgi:hypothetical protein
MPNTGDYCLIVMLSPSATLRIHSAKHLLALPKADSSLRWRSIQNDKTQVLTQTWYKLLMCIENALYLLERTSPAFQPLPGHRGTPAEQAQTCKENSSRAPLLFPLSYDV